MWKTIILAGATIGVLAPGPSTENVEINWWTVDGGGVTWSTGGAFEVGGSIGQPDAGAMIGGDFRLVGGFWATPACWCVSDVNHDGRRNGSDVQRFVACLLENGGEDCACADLDQSGGLNSTDVSLFVAGLLTSGACP